MFLAIYQICKQLKFKTQNSIDWRLGRIQMRLLKISFGKNMIIQGKLYFNVGLNANIHFGENCCIKSGRGLNVLSKNVRSSLRVEDNATLMIADNCRFSSVCLWSHKSILIGNNVNVGADSIIMDSDAHSLSYEHRRDVSLDMQNKVSKEIVIEDDVLIGARCIVLKGVTIGARSVIGSGSVVVNDIPSDCVAAGNPAKVIKKLV